MGIVESKKSVSFLETCTLSNTPEFSLDGQTVLAKAIDIHDGDTFTAAISVDQDQ